MDKQPTVGQSTLFQSEVRQMPVGYYSGDQPNPNLRAFVEAHMAERSHDPEHDDYDMPAFNIPIETTKATAIYNMHTYWSKKPHDAIRQYIEHYTQPGDLVLDPFCGSGSTALAALVTGRKTIAIDRSPSATFITKNYCTPVDVTALKQAFVELKQKVKPEVDWLYATRCDRCDGPASTTSTVYSQVFQCSRCLEKMPLFDCIEIKGQNVRRSAKIVNVCPFCYKLGFEEEISTRAKRFGSIPVAVSYKCKGRCKPSHSERQHNDSDPKKREYFERYDLGKIQEIKDGHIPCWYPTQRMMNAPEEQERWGVKWRAGTSNFRTVDELFTKRNLWALATILEACKASELSSELLFVFESNVLGGTIMQRYREGGGGFANGTYYVPQLSIEREQLGCITRKFNDVVGAQIELQRNIQTTCLAISTQSSTDLSALPLNSVDYILLIRHMLTRYNTENSTSSGKPGSA